MHCLSTGTQRGDDHTGVQMTSNVSESMLRKRGVVNVNDDTRADSPETPLEQSNTISDVGQ